MGWRIDLVPGSQPPLSDDVKAKIKATGRRGEVARFRLTVRRGTQDRRRAMVEVIKEAAEGDFELGPRPACAAGDGLRPADDFLRAEAAPRRAVPARRRLIGLAMRDDPRALDLLFESGQRAVAYEAMRFLRPGRVTDAIPRLIDRLADPDHTARANAEEVLRGWTGREFGHTWDGYNHERPTPEEGRAMQPMYRDWWAKNRGELPAPIQAPFDRSLAIGRGVGRVRCGPRPLPGAMPSSGP